jgi:hypothetical protein
MDSDAIRGQLEAKGVEAACPVCKRSVGWNLATPDGGTAFLMVHHPVDGTMSLHVLPFVCGNCGFVRLHSSSDLMDNGPS